MPALKSAIPARGMKMNKLLSTLFVLLLQLPVLAAAQERDVASAPAETVSMTYVVVFGIVFVGMIVGFFAYLFMNDKGEDATKK
jgi:hypothetical protein